MSQENLVWLACEKCGRKNYTTHFSKIKDEKLDLKKFCKNCRTHTLHKQTK